MLTPEQRETLDEIPTREILDHVSNRTTAFVAAFSLPSNDPDGPIVCLTHGRLSDCIALASCLQHTTIGRATSFNPP